MGFVARSVRNEELGKFLLSRRQRMSAESCGLAPPRLRRRTPGLRREDVSSIAGISTAYYTWIEQGRPFDISADVLDAIAGALRLSEVETSYVFALAGKVELRPRLPQPSTTEIMQLVSGFENGPALALTPWLDVLGGNAQARDLFEYEAGMNLASWFFCAGGADAKPRDSDELAVALVALLRRNRARGDEGRVGEIIDRLRSESRDFALLWEAQIVDSSPMVEVAFERPSGCETYQSMLLCDSVASRQYALFMIPVEGILHGGGASRCLRDAAQAEACDQQQRAESDRVDADQ